MLRSWWLPWVIILVLAFGIGRLGAEIYLVDRGPNSLYEFPQIETPVAFVAQDMRLYAYHWASLQPLTLIVVRVDRPGIETCEAGAGFRRWFALLTDVRNGGRIEDESSDFDSLDWASLTIGEEWEEHGLAATRFVAHIPRAGEDGPVIIERFSSYYVVKDADLEAWGLIWSGCAGLGAGS
jgi:hypothetical protein